MSQNLETPVRRRKTTEACDPCRSRKLKCDGMFPCGSCEKNKIECKYDPSTSGIKIRGELDVLNARMMEVERAVFGERNFKPRRTVESADITPMADKNNSGATITNDEDGTLSYYGSTSTVALLKTFEEKVHQARSNGIVSERPSKRARHETNDCSESSDASRNPLKHNIYLSSSPPKAEGLRLPEKLQDSHFAAFAFRAHDIIPILDIIQFEFAYEKYSNPSSSISETNHCRQSQCLIYSTVAIGCLYNSNGAALASKYFAEAQILFGVLLYANSIEVVQAAMLMAFYAHHTGQPNVAYNYLGSAIRLAYSSGINRNLDEAAVPTSKIQSARRTWWTLYSLESELCMEYGRPLCIRETDSVASYPQQILDPSDSRSKITFIVVMAKFGRIVRKIIDLVSNIDEKSIEIESFVGRMMNHQAELMAWREELPVHLQIRNSEGSVNRTTFDFQCAEIELRFNRVMLMMHRPFFAYKNFSSPFYTSSMARIVCLGAAQETLTIFFKARLSLLEKSFYYHRVIAAALVILTIAFDSPLEEKCHLLETCSKSVKLFEDMQSNFSNFGTAIVRDALNVLSPAAVRPSGT